MLCASQNTNCSSGLTLLTMHLFLWLNYQQLPLVAVRRCGSNTQLISSNLESPLFQKPQQSSIQNFLTVFVYYEISGIVQI